jgi:hypothetical protein
MKKEEETRAQESTAPVEASPSQESVPETNTPAASSETEDKALDTVPRRRAPAAELPEVPADLALLPGLLEAWGEWLTYRKERRLPTAPSTAKGMFVKLREFQQAGHDPVGVIHNSIAQGWQGLFPPRAEHVVKFQPRPKTTEEANQKLLASIEAGRDAVRGVFG